MIQQSHSLITQIIENLSLQKNMDQVFIVALFISAQILVTMASVDGLSRQ